jgi:hypothetical protein
MKKNILAKSAKEFNRCFDEGDAVKKLGFAWDKDRKGWKKEVSAEELNKVKELKVEYDMI